MKLLRELEFSLSIGCRLNCRFCPQDLIMEKYLQKHEKRIVNMGLENFKQILKNVEKGGLISFSGMVEPFHNSECAKMIKYAYDEGYRVCLFTTLMGMKKNDLEILKSVKLEFFVLHIPDEEENCHFVIDDEYIGLLQEIQKYFTPNEYSCHGTVHDKVKPYIDENIPAGIYLGDRAGNLPEVTGIAKKTDHSQILCVSGFGKSTSEWSPVCLPDGTLVACCNDYGMQHIFGNLLESKWDEIEKREPYQHFRKSWDNLTDDCLCSKCSAAIPVAHLPSRKLSKLLTEENYDLSEFSNQEQKQIALLKSGKRKVIYGAGIYFRDYYQYMQWDRALPADAIVDRNPALWGTKISALPCVSLQEIEKDALLIVFVKNAATIVKELKSCGYNYVIAIGDIFSLAEQL